MTRAGPAAARASLMAVHLPLMASKAGLPVSSHQSKLSKEEYSCPTLCPHSSELYAQCTVMRCCSVCNFPHMRLCGPAKMAKDLGRTMPPDHAG